VKTKSPSMCVRLLLQVAVGASECRTATSGKFKVTTRWKMTLLAHGKSFSVAKAAAATSLSFVNNFEQQKCVQFEMTLCTKETA